LRLLGGRRWVARLARRAPAPIRSWLSLAAAGPGGGRGPSLPAVVEPEGAMRGTAVLLTGCAPARLFPSTARSAAALLARAGVRVLVPPAQSCCGALALHLGADARARSLARPLAARVAATGADWVVGVAAGCGALLREYDRLLPDDAAAATVARRTRDVLEVLDELGLPP